MVSTKNSESTAAESAGTGIANGGPGFRGVLKLVGCSKLEVTIGAVRTR